MPVRLFTRHAATRLLPLVTRIVADLQETQRAMEQARAFGKLGRPLYRDLQRKVHLLHGELEDLGCFFTTTNGRSGQVEFPADSGERTSYLCWQPGEKEVNRLRHANDALPSMPLSPADDPGGLAPSAAAGRIPR